MPCRPELPAWPAEADHGTLEDRAAPSLARRRDLRRRSQPPDRRADSRGAVARARRPSGARVQGANVDAGPVSRGRVGVRPADGAALLAAQHAGLPADRADLAPERPAAGGAVAHGPHQPRAPAGRDHPVRRGDSLGRRRDERGEHARGLRRAPGERAPAPRFAEDVQQPGPRSQPTRARTTWTSTASRSSTRWCARTPFTDRGRCTFTSRRRRTSRA